MRIDAVLIPPYQLQREMDLETYVALVDHPETLSVSEDYQQAALDELLWTTCSAVYSGFSMPNSTMSSSKVRAV